MTQTRTRPAGSESGVLPDEMIKIIDEDETLTERIDGDVLVRNGATVVVNGMVGGKLVVEGTAMVTLNGVVLALHVREEGRAVVNGMVAGAVTVERTGYVRVSGMAFGPLMLAYGANWETDPGARIGGRLV